VDKQDFVKMLNASDKYGALEFLDGVAVVNFETMEKFAVPDARIHEMQKEEIFEVMNEFQYHNGKNVDGITRVTGYFSHTSNWNKGKLAELKDRYRENIDTKAMS